MKTFFLIVALLVGSSWVMPETLLPQDGKVVKMRVLSHRNDCSAEGGLNKCCVYQIDGSIGSDSWSMLDHKISGFTYEAGYIYDLKVRVDDKDAPTSFELVKVLSKTKS